MHQRNDLGVGALGQVGQLCFGLGETDLIGVERHLEAVLLVDKGLELTPRLLRVLPSGTDLIDDILRRAEHCAGVALSDGDLVGACGLYDRRDAAGVGPRDIGLNGGILGLARKILHRLIGHRQFHLQLLGVPVELVQLEHGGETTLVHPFGFDGYLLTLAGNGRGPAPGVIGGAGRRGQREGQNQ